MNKPIDFSHVAVFTDIHYGLRNNSREHNDACEKFLIWFIEQAKKQNIKTCIFGGDWHHIRANLNVSTLNYSVSGLQLLNDYFDNTIFIIGNHDMYYKDKYEIHSIPYASKFPNIRMIESITEIDQVAFVPFLVGDDWKKVPKLTAPYLFGHLELPKFKMNGSYEMPDHGQLNATHFTNQKQVFSGHFHKKQNSGKIWYIGNPFPHDYGDSWDDDRGMMLWKPGQQPNFINWPDAVKYRTLTLSQLITNPKKFIDHKTYARVTIDIEANYEDIIFIRELLESELNAKDIQMISAKIDDLEMIDDAEINFESVDTIVISHLESLDSITMDKKELIRIYEDL